MQGLGLRAKRTRTCQACGLVFETTKATARYCGDVCRVASSRYGRSYGNTEPKLMKVYR